MFTLPCGASWTTRARASGASRGAVREAAAARASTGVAKPHAAADATRVIRTSAL
ncbi:MAG: hypothetical protein HY071_02510 [Chloroflexi bacterium]|nr:hypothetical protein [Chloroflexota bacterium]